MWGQVAASWMWLDWGVENSKQGPTRGEDVGCCGWHLAMQCDCCPRFSSSAVWWWVLLLRSTPFVLTKRLNYTFCLHSTFRRLGGILFSFPFCHSALCLSVKVPDAPTVRAALLLGAANTAQLNLHFTTESAALSLCPWVCASGPLATSHTNIFGTHAPCVWHTGYWEVKVLGKGCGSIHRQESRVWPATGNAVDIFQPIF